MVRYYVSIHGDDDIEIVKSRLEVIWEHRRRDC